MLQLSSWYQDPDTWKNLNLAARGTMFEKFYIPKIIWWEYIQSWDYVVEFWSWQWHKSEILLESWIDMKFTGIELEQQMLDKSIERLWSHVDLRQWNMIDIQSIPERMDVACFFQSLHHLNTEQRSQVATNIYQNMNDNARVIIVDSFQPENDLMKQIFDSVNRFYAVLWHYPDTKIQQITHALMSIISPDIYNAEDYGYFSPQEYNILWEKQDELFDLKESIDVKAYGFPCISKILIFKKK